jgi:hypothetical protein
MRQLIMINLLNNKCELPDTATRERYLKAGGAAVRRQDMVDAAQLGVDLQADVAHHLRHNRHNSSDQNMIQLCEFRNRRPGF